MNTHDIERLLDRMEREGSTPIDWPEYHNARAAVEADRKHAVDLIARYQEKIRALEVENYALVSELDDRKCGSEPVAWAIFADNGNIRIWARKPMSHPDCVPLYTAPQPAEPAAVPPGWRLVPCEPTLAMLDSADEAIRDFPRPASPYEIPSAPKIVYYRALLSAAPMPPAQPQPYGNTDAGELHRFYGVETDADLIAAQQRHIEKLQARPVYGQAAVTRQREG